MPHPAPRARLLSLSLSLSFSLLLAAAHAAPAAWPQYRGPHASGLDSAVALPTTFDVASGKNLRFATAIPGLAHASPIIWENRVFVATAIAADGARSDLKVGLYGDIASAKDTTPHQWRLLAVDKRSGQILWNTLAHEAVPRVARHTKATHANSTPATDGRHVVALFGSEGLFCFNADDGKLLWKKDLGPMDSGYFQMPSAQWGFASSPIINDGKIVVLVDVQKDSFLASFDVATGRELWRTPRKDVPTWSTPTLVTAAGRTQIAVNGWHETAGYDFATGRQFWKLDGGGDIPVPTPIFAHDLIYFTSAHGRSRPIRAIRPDATGDITPDNSDFKHPSIAWNHDRRGNYMQTPIVVGDLIYACNDSGLLTCFDARTGEVRYSERLAANTEGYTSSPVSDGRHLYFTSEQGNVFVIPVGPKFSVAGTSKLGETCLSTPAISEGALFFRTREKLIAVAAQ